jgi:hypothetical protein
MVRRSLITSSGFLPEADPGVSAHLEELNTFLGKRIFDQAAKAGAARRGGAGGEDPVDVLKQPLTPKRSEALAPRPPRWANPSLVLTLKNANERDDRITLADYIDKTNQLSELKYRFDELILNERPTLPPNVKVVLDGDYGAIRDYLVAYAYLFKGIREIHGLKNFVFAGRDGIAKVIEYAAVSAARDLIKEKAFDVDNLDDDDSQIVKDITAALGKTGKLSLSVSTFDSDVLAIVDDNLFDGKYLKLIERVTIADIPSKFTDGLVEYMKQFEQTTKIPISGANVNYVAAQFLGEVNGISASISTDPSTAPPSEKDFDVDFIVDDSSQIVVSKAAVKCAAQLYYSMVLGDELNVFGAVDYFTKRYLLRGGVEVSDPRLRDHLQEYVFSNRFKDLKTGEVLDRTRPAERQVFYRQVFSAPGPEMADAFVNDDFPRHWKILMLECAEYLERAQDSPNPDNYVSRQKVAQAVEDLQYNLSTHCTGMANVITPLVYAEANFVIKNIFQHQDVVKQVAPIGGTWWRVVERLLSEMNGSRPRATVLYNKAKYGFDIIRSIAEYNPATFENDADFSTFISSVDAFITTQSILQHALEDALKGEEGEEEARTERAMPAPVGVGAPPASNGHAPSDDWDF